MNIFKTTDLDKINVNQLRLIFKDSFGKLPSEKQLITKYTSGCFGFSFHCLFFNSKDLLVGSFTLIPKKFIYRKREIVGLHLIDTCFPYPGEVNPFKIKKALLKTINYCTEYFDFSLFLYGFPNKKIIKLWDALLNWQHIDSLHSMIDFSPIMTILNKNFQSDDPNKLLLKTPNLCYNPRLFSFKNTTLNFGPSGFINIWCIRKIIPIQIVDQLSLVSKPKLLKGFNILKIWRLFIPSIICHNEFSKKCFWHYPLKKDHFPIFILDSDKIFNLKKLSLKTSFMWNDVP